MANARILGLPDLMALPSATIIPSTSYSASYPASNALNTDPSSFWRSVADYAGREWDGLVGFNENTADMRINSVGVVGHNLWNRTGQVRILLANNTLDDNLSFQYLVPTGSSNASNMTGDHTGVDSGAFASDDVGLSQTSSASAASIDLTFDTPAAAPRADAISDTYGTYMTIRLRALASVDCDPWNAPTVEVEALSGGGGSLGVKSVTKSDGQWMYFTVPYALLGASDGSTFEIRVTINSNASESSVATVDEILWEVEHTQISGDGSILADSGWFQATGDLALLSGHYPIPSVTNKKSLMHTFGQTYSGVKFIGVYFREDHTPFHTDSANLITGIQPIGYVEIGKLVAGISLEVDINVTPGDYLSSIDASTKLYTDGGTMFGQRVPTRRGMNLNFEWLSEAQGAFVFERWLLEGGILQPVLISRDPDNSVTETMACMYATLRQAENQIRDRTTDTYKLSMTIQVEEKR